MFITGKIIAVIEKRTGIAKTSGKSWEAQEYVLETQDSNPRKICFDVFGADKIKEFNIKVMDMLTIHFDIDAREYNGRWINSFRAWKVERASIGTGGLAAPMPESLTAPFESDLAWNSTDDNVPPF